MNQSTANNSHSTFHLPLSTFHLALFACWLAQALRAYQLTAQGLWIDEASSVHLALASLPELLANRADSLHPPLYFALLKVWVTFAGSSEFAVRCFSLAGGVLTTAAAYRVARRMFDPLTGLAAALAAALLPALVYYSQETRVYAFMPLVYLLLLERAWQVWNGRAWRARDWALLALLEIIGLYLHAFTGLMIATLNVFLAGVWLARKTQIDWKHWIISQAAVGAAYLPWILAVALFSRSVAGKIVNYYPGSISPDLRGYAHMLWFFFNTGLVEARWTPSLHITLGGMLSIVMPVALALALALDRRRGALGLAALFAGLPLLAGYAVWLWRPPAHPRYMIFTVAPLIVIAGRCIAWLVQGKEQRATSNKHLQWARRLAGVLVAALLLSVWLPSLNVIYFDDRFARDDVRGLAARLAQGSQTSDAFIVPEGDYALAYYYHGPARVVQARLRSGELDAAQLQRDLSGQARATLVTYPYRRTLDPLNSLPFLLELNGRLTARFQYNHMAMEEYALADTWTLPQLKPASAWFTPPGEQPVLKLTGAFLQNPAATDNAVVVALRWQLAQPITYPLKATVVMWDPLGWRLSGQDVPMLDGQGRTTNLWQAGAEVVNYYIVPAPLGVAPRDYELTVKVYNSITHQHLQHEDTGYEDLSLGYVTLEPGVDFSRDPYDSRQGLILQPGPGELADGLALQGYSVYPPNPQPGDVLDVNLRWKATRGHLPAYQPIMRLTQNGQTLAESGGEIFTGVFSSDRWDANFVLVEQRPLIYPLAGGDTRLELAIGQQTFTLANFSFDAGPIHLLPESKQARFGEFARLVAYRTDPPAEPDHALRVTLYWQAIGTTRVSYTVFTHLLDAAGRLAAQHDGPPAGGARLTYTWKPGELIADAHNLAYGPGRICGGPFSLTTGWYNPVTLEHVATDAGDTLELAHDIYIECEP